MTEQNQASADPANRLLDAEEVAAMLGGGITRATVIRRWRKWGLTGHRVGKFLRWTEQEVIDYINSHRAA